MQIYNCDETDVSVVHKPGRVLAELGRRNVNAVMSGERGKTHTVLSCVSAAGSFLPPMMVYPRKRATPDNCKEGALKTHKGSQTHWNTPPNHTQYSTKTEGHMGRAGYKL